MSNLYRGPFIDASHQVSVHLAEVSEEKIKMWKVNRRRMPSDGQSSHCLWQDELKRVVNNFTIPCLGPLNWYIFGSWIFSVSEYTIQIYPVYSEGYLRKILAERRGKFAEPPKRRGKCFLSSKPVFFANNPH